MEKVARPAGDPIPGGPIEFDTPILDPPHHLVIAPGRRRLALWTIGFNLSYRLRNAEVTRRARGNEHTGA
jgi:hypothetical protein